MISIKPLDSPINQQQYGDMTYRQYAYTYNIDDRKVPYGPDMFYLSVNTIADKNFTFAVDEDENLVAALAFDGGTYAPAAFRKLRREIRCFTGKRPPLFLAFDGAGSPLPLTGSSITQNRAKSKTKHAVLFNFPSHISCLSCIVHHRRTKKENAPAAVSACRGVPTRLKRPEKGGLKWRCIP